MPFSPRRAGSVAYSLVMFVIVSVLAGVLIAGLFVPLAGMAGVSSKAAATELESLPAALSTPAPPTRSRVLMADGKPLAFFFDENRVPVRLDEIAPVMRQAQLAIEDHRFYQHGALDIKGTLRALVRNSTSDTGTQGGSSVTQQYVKMVSIQACDGNRKCIADAQEASMKRKIRELRYAIALEKKFSKDEILKRYLNIAYYGDGAYGVEAAARHYFSVRSSELNLAQAAMLAGLVQNPDANNPMRNLSAALDRRDVVLNRMASPDVAMITPAQAAKAKKVRFDRKAVKSTRAGCQETKYPFLCDYVKLSLLKNPALGKTVQDRRDLLNRGGLTIQTAIDPKTQDIAQKAVSNVVGPTDPLISTMDMIQPGTGLIIAMAQSRPVMGTNKKKGETYFNYSADQSMSGAEGYQAGSTFKVFTAAAALEKGIPLTKRYNARSPMDFSNVPFSSCIGTAIDPNYRPKNSTGTNGPMDMYTGAARSVNTYFLQLERDVGICPVTKMAEKLGVRLADPKLEMTKSPTTQVPSFTLGVSEVTPLSMAEAYATFAARGVHCDPIIISRITDRTGRKLPTPSANCKQVISPAVADGMNKLLGRVMTGNGTGTRVRVPAVRYQAGKTGTINGNKAVWFNGYTPEISGSAMIAIDPTRSTWKSGYRKSQGVAGYRVPSTGFGLEGSGSGDAGVKIWQPAMTAAMKGRADTAFKEPPSSILRGKQVRVPSVYGLGLEAGTQKLEREGFSVERRYVFSNAAKFSFLGFTPGSYASVPEFSTIYANISKGRDPAIAEAARRRAEEAAEARREAAEARKEAAAEAKKEAAEKKKAEEDEEDGG